MKYWVYINGQVLERPYEQGELSSINGFTRETLICPEVVGDGQQQEWVAAHLVFEPAVEQPSFPQPAPQPLPGYYQYPQQTFQQPVQAQPYQTTRIPNYVPQQIVQPVVQPVMVQPVVQPAYAPAYQQPVYQQAYEEQYDAAAQTQNFETQDMFDHTNYDAQTQDALLQKIDILTKEIQDVKQKLYSLSDNLESSSPRSYNTDVSVKTPPHHSQKEKSEHSQEQKEPQPKEEDDAASVPSVHVPGGYVDDLAEVFESDKDNNTVQTVSSDSVIMDEPATEMLDEADTSTTPKDMDAILKDAMPAVAPSEDFLQDAINTTFSNKHKKESQTNPGEIVDLARKENTLPKAPEQIGTVVTDGNSLTEDDIPTVEEEFDSKLSFTQSNIGKEPAHSAQEEEPSEEEQPQAQNEEEPAFELEHTNEGEPLNVDLPSEEPQFVQEVEEGQQPLPAFDDPAQEQQVDITETEKALGEPAGQAYQISEEDKPVTETVEQQAEQSQPFSIGEETEEQKDTTQTATAEEVFTEHPAEEDLPQQEELAEEPAAQEEAYGEVTPEQEPLPADEPQYAVAQEDYQIQGEIPSAQNIETDSTNSSYNAMQQNLQEQEVASDEPPTQPADDDRMNIEASENEQEKDVLAEFAADKEQLENNSKDMTSSAFDVVDNSKAAQGDSALEELTGNQTPAMAPMQDQEDKFLKTFTSSIEEVFLDQPTSIISDYVPPAQTADAFDADQDAFHSAPEEKPGSAASLMDLKSAPQQQADDQEGLKKVRRIKPAAIKTVPMVAANGGDLNTNASQPNIEEAIAELGGNSPVEKILKMFGTISGLLVVLLLFVALLAAMHIIPASWSPVNILISKFLKKPAAEETAGDNAVDASVEQALKEKQAKMAAAAEVINKVKSYQLPEGLALGQKINTLHAKVADQIEWTADQAVDPSYYSVAAKLPANQEGYSLTYRFSYSTLDNTLVPTTSEANNIMQTPLPAPANQQQLPQVISPQQMPQMQQALPQYPSQQMGPRAPQAQQARPAPRRQ